MSYIAGHIFQYEDLEVAIVVGKSIKTREEAERIANSSKVSFAKLYNDKIVIGKGEKYMVLHSEDKNLYQFSVCRDGDLCFRTDEDYEKISWKEAIAYASTHYERFTLPVSLGSLAFFTCEEDKFEFN
ncbi:hypothetical protein MZM54_02040 [[Brevibacterium] frigoritolerans]|nr:hypothetical protein [Peribacillus frigoritolerans]